jgi:hypothetical protein
MRRIVVVSIIGAVVLVVALLTYIRVGWNEMVQACDIEGLQSEDGTHTSVAYSWSWQPLGFTCTYEDGSSETSLWF